MPSKMHAIIYKSVCTLFVLFLLLGAIGMFLDRHDLKGGIGFVAGGIIAFLFFRKPAIWNWVIIILTLLVAMYCVGKVT
jgi:hypothetical protein